MREVLVFKTPEGSIGQKSIGSNPPQLQPGEVLIRVVAVGLNPKDWKYTDENGTNQGDDVAGYVALVGHGVKNFRIGDRVVAFHDMLTKGGGYAEYAVAGEHATAHLADKVQFEDAATAPLPALTAALALYQDLDDLPYPWKPAKAPTPLLVYGGSTTVGLFAIKIALLANIHPIIAVAGGGAGVVHPFLDASKGDVVVDYRQGAEGTVAGIKKALQGRKLLRAFDTVVALDSFKTIAQVLDQEEGQTTQVLPFETSFPGKIRHVTTYVKTIYSEENTFSGAKKSGTVGYREFGRAFINLFSVGLAEGWFPGHPVRLVPNGLDGLGEALTNMKNGKISGQRYVARVADTPGLADPNTTHL